MLKRREGKLMKLRNKYFLIFFSVFLVISLAMSFIAYFLSNHILIHKYEEMSDENLSYIMEITEKELNQLTNTFGFLANNTLVLERIQTDYRHRKAFEKIRDDRIVTHTINAMSTFDVFVSIQGIYIYGYNGEEYWHTIGNDFFENTTIQEELSKVEISSTGLTYLGIEESYYHLADTEHVLKFARKLYNDFGAAIGLIYFELDADYFRKLYNNERIYSDRKLFLTDHEGRMIYHESKNLVSQKLDPKGHTGITVEKELVDYGWKLISMTPADRIYDENSLIIKVTLITAAISIILEMLILMVITGRIVRPINKLTKAMTQVRHGDLQVQVDHKSDDEIGLLTHNFNRMTQQLKENMDKEIAYNKAMNDAEYKALQAQINPHFMYNSLNALKWLAGIQKADNIINIVDALWILLRKTSSLKGQFVPLKSEIEIIDAYGMIQQVRYKGKFEIIYAIQDEHMGNIIPKYILQPFVENAIFYGIEPKKGPGTIQVVTEVVGDDLKIMVMDDGVGIEKEKLRMMLTDSSKHQHEAGLNPIGIKNVDERLKLLYGNHYGVHIDSTLGEGTTITIHIPINASEEG